MFKRLRERIAEEATKFPVGQHAFGNSPGKLMSNPNARPTTENSTEDLITLSDSSSVVPLSSPQQFSIAEDEDGSASEQNTPQKRLANSSAGSEQFFTPNSSGSEPSNSLSMEATNVFSNYQPSKGPPYVPQSDIESEVEEPPTLNLDGISKEQLLTTNQMLKARLCKYKFKYQEVVKAYKDVNDVKKKIEHALIESQDKGLRRIAELREQCQLEQKAKAHLEENLRLILEEKDSRISVLETQINLLKEGQSEGIGQSSGTQFCRDIVSNEEVAVPGSTDEIANESTVLNEKIKKLQALLVECKNSILGKSAQITQLTSEKDSLARELEIKVKEVENFQDNDAKLQSAHDVQLKSLRSRLTELEQQQGESSMSMAETKKNMHEELELKERQLNKAKEEARQFQLAVDHEKAVIAELKKQHEDRVNELQTQLANTEKAMEDEKESLMKDLSRGKAEGVLLMQQEYAKKLATAEDDWKNKLREMTLNEKAWKSKEEELLNKLQQKEDELLANQQNIGEHKAIIEELKCEKQDLIKSSEDFKNGAKPESFYVEKINELQTSKGMIISELESNRSKLLNQLEEYKTALNSTQSDFGDLKKLNESLKAELNESKLFLNHKDIENQKVKESNLKEMDKLKEYLSLTLSEKEELADQLDEGKIALHSLQSDCDDLRKSVESFKDELNESKLALSLKDVEYKNCQGSNQKEIDKLKGYLAKTIFQKEQLLCQLEENKNVLRCTQSECDDLRKLVEAQKSELKESKLSWSNKDNDNKKIKDSNQMEMDKLKEYLSLIISEKEELAEQLEECCKESDNFKELWIENDGILKKYASYNKELSAKNEVLLREKEEIKQLLSAKNSAFSEIKSVLQATEETLIATQSYCSNMKQQFLEDSEKLEDLEQTVRRLELQNVDLKTSLFNLKEISSKQITAICSLEEKLDTLLQDKEVSEKNYVSKIKNCKAKLADVNIINFNLEEQLAYQNHKNEEMQSKLEQLQNVIDSIKMAESKVLKQGCENEPSNSELNNELTNEKEMLQTNTFYISKENKDLENMSLENNAVIKHTDSSMKDIQMTFSKLEVKLKELLNKYNKIEKEQDNLDAEGQNLIRKNRVPDNQGAVSVKQGFRKKKKVADKAENCLEDMTEVSTTYKIYEEERTEIYHQVKLLQSLINQIETENISLKEEVAKIKQWSESHDLDLVNEISRLQKCLNDVQEERNDLSMVLQSLEVEASKNGNNSAKNNYTDEDVSKLQEESLPVEKCYKSQIIEMKTSIQDLQYRETEQNNLLEKTRTRYENQITELNLKVKAEIETLTGQTNCLNDELQKLKEQLEFSQKDYEEKVGQLTCKLLYKTENLINLKQELDAALQKVSQAEISISELQQQLIEKEEDFAIVFSDKQELETKIQDLEQISTKHECELKEIHNAQLCNLRDQTKQTIDKLHEQIKEKAVQQAIDFKTSIAEINDQHNTEISRLRIKLQEYQNVHQSESDEKMSNIQNNLDTTALKLHEITLLKEEEMQTRLLVEERAKEWEVEYQKLQSQIDFFMANQGNSNCDELLANDCKFKTTAEKLATILSQLLALQEDNRKLSEELKCGRQNYELQLKTVVETFREKNMFLQQKIMSHEKIFDKQMADFQNKALALCKGFDCKIDSVTTKFTDSSIKLQQKYKNLYNLYVTEGNTLKTEIQTLKETLHLQCSDTDAHLSQIEKFTVDNISMEGKINSLSEIVEQYELICKKYVPNALSADALQNYIKNLNTKCKNFVERIRDLENNISDSEKITHLLGLKEQEISKLNNDMSNLTQKYNAAESKVEQLSTQIDTVEKERKRSLEENEKLIEQFKNKAECLSLSISDKDKSYNIIEGRLKTANQELLDLEQAHTRKIENILSEHKMEKEETISHLKEDSKVKLGELKKKAELKLTQIKKQLEAEKDQASKCAEDKLTTAETNYKNQITELKGRITQLKAQIVDLEQENREKITALQNEFKTQLNKNISELSSKLKTKDKELEMQREKSEKEKKEQTAKAHILQESVKDKENIITQLKSNMSSLESINVSKVEDLNKRIKQLEHEREQLMLQAQERVAATDSKCREDIKQLEEKIHELQSQNKEIEKLRNDIILLNSQLDESLLVAEANQAANSQEISVMKSQLTESQEKLTATIKTHSTKEVQLESKIQELQDENATLLFQNKCIENLKQEKTDLNEIIKTLENKMACSANLEDEVRLLKSQNEQLHSELDTLVTLKKEKDQLNLKIRSLELVKKDLSETVKLLKFENESLKKSPMQGAIASPQSAELALLKEENEAFKKKILILEQIDIKDPVNSSLKQYIDIVRKECEEKISVNEAEMEGKFKNLIKKFSTQMDVKDYACDQLVSEVFEKNENQEGKLQREHRIEIAALRQDIFEKDCALEEMHEHYEGIIQEKEAKIKECEKNLLSTNPPSKSGASSGIPGQDASDWDDTWVVPEESCESSSPFHSGKAECETHLQQIETMQEELAKCNSEIKDLRILLRLSPPQSLASNNNYSHSSAHLPEPTEFEYLRNILFEYMMGKETVTLAKVIAAVLKFNEEQTRLVIQKEESKHAMK